MATRGAVRWRPDVGRSASQATIMDFNPAPLDENGLPSGGPPTGSVVMIAQVIAYNNERVDTAAKPYRPGHQDTEEDITVLYEQVFTKELAVIGKMTQAQAEAEWAATLQSFRDTHLGAIDPLIKAIRAARRSKPLLF